METLRFAPLKGRVDVTFWSPLGDLKLHSLKLEEGPVPLRASWTASNHAELPGMFTVSAQSLPAPANSAGGAAAGEVAAAGAPPPPSSGFVAAGSLYVVNTVERIVQFDRKAAVQQVCDRIWAAIESGEAERDPAVLQGVVLLVYCDLKHYKYRYWFSFPALQPPQAFTAGPAASLQQALGEERAAAAAAACTQHAASSGQPAWLVAVGSSGEVEAAPLTDWQRLQQLAVNGSWQVYLAAADSCNLPAHPGWPLRNLLLMAAARWRCQQLRVLCLRERHGRFDAAASLCLDVTLPQLPASLAPSPLGGWEANERGKVGPRSADLAPTMDPRQLAASAVTLNLDLMRWRAAPALQVRSISATRCLLLGAGTLGCSVARVLLGWGVRHITFVDNSRVSYSNPVRQSLFNFDDCLGGGKPKAAAAAEAVTRIFPGVTAQGVHMSIPMPGHQFASSEMGQVRADIAALESLIDAHDVVFLLMDTRESRWLPTLLCAARGRLAINAALGFDGFMVMRHGAPVPLPHPAAAEQADGAEAAGAGAVDAAEVVGAGAAEAEVAGGQGQQEAPSAGGDSSTGPAASSVVAAQPAAAAAAGPAEQAAVAGSSNNGGGGSSSLGGGSYRLGCYFCNDVVAPVNSTVDRAMDQQCTVARPGLSGIAGSLAVELMAAVLQHPLGASAPPAGSEASRAFASEHELPLGEVPHMVRGQLSGFSQMCLTGQAFRQCTACSEAVVAEYRRGGHDFLVQGLMEPRQLEDLTGLTELHIASEAALEAWEGSEDEDEEDGGQEGQGQGKEGEAVAAAGEDDGWEEL